MRLALVAALLAAACATAYREATPEEQRFNAAKAACELLTLEQLDVDAVSDLDPMQAVIATMLVSECLEAQGFVLDPWGAAEEVE